MFQINHPSLRVSQCGRQLAADSNRNSAFIALSLATALLTLGLIVFGAVVRVTDSGLGCGRDWPLCNGAVFPPLDNIAAWIEWLHRLFALLIGLFGLLMLALAWRRYRQVDRRVLNMTFAAAALFVLQSALGAIVVVLELPPTFVTLHLARRHAALGGFAGRGDGGLVSATEAVSSGYSDVIGHDERRFRPCSSR